SAIRTAMIEITTSSSIRVNARRLRMKISLCMESMKDAGRRSGEPIPTESTAATFPPLEGRQPVEHVVCTPIDLPAGQGRSRGLIGMSMPDFECISCADFQEQWASSLDSPREGSPTATWGDD